MFMLMGLSELPNEYHAGSAAGGTDGAGIAELHRSTSDALPGIASDGNHAIRKMIGLQGYAREAQRVCGMK